MQKLRMFLFITLVVTLTVSLGISAAAAPTTSSTITGAVKTGSIVTVNVDIVNTAQSMQATLIAGVYNGSGRLVGAAATDLPLPVGPSSQTITVTCADQAYAQSVKVFLLDSGAQPISESAEAPVTGGGTLSVSGSVKDYAGNKISGASVQLKAGYTVINEGRSNDNGNFSIDIPEGTYRLVISANGFETITTSEHTFTDSYSLPALTLYKTINLNRTSYDIYESGSVMVFDSAQNHDPNKSESISIRLSSTTEPYGRTITLNELGTNSSQFMSLFSTKQFGNSSGMITVSAGDTLAATYIKATGSGDQSFTAVASISSTVARTIDRVMAANGMLRITLEGKPTTAPTTGDFTATMKIGDGTASELPLTDFHYDGNVTVTYKFEPVPETGVPQGITLRLKNGTTVTYVIHYQIQSELTFTYATCPLYDVSSGDATNIGKYTANNLLDISSQYIVNMQGYSHLDDITFPSGSTGKYIGLLITMNKDITTLEGKASGMSEFISFTEADIGEAATAGASGRNTFILWMNTDDASGFHRIQVKETGSDDSSAITLNITFNAYNDLKVTRLSIGNNSHPMSPDIAVGDELSIDATMNDGQPASGRVLYSVDIVDPSNGINVSLMRDVSSNLFTVPETYTYNGQTYPAVGTNLYIFVCVDGDIERSYISRTITERPLPQDAPAGLTANSPTSYGGNDGSITHVTSQMEYSSADDPFSYTRVTGLSITSLSPGWYFVRYAAGPGYDAGPVTSIQVEKGHVGIINSDAAVIWDDGVFCKHYDMLSEGGSIIITCDESADYIPGDVIYLRPVAGGTSFIKLTSAGHQNVMSYDAESFTLDGSLSIQYSSDCIIFDATSETTGLWLLISPESLSVGCDVKYYLNGLNAAYLVVVLRR